MSEVPGANPEGEERGRKPGHQDSSRQEKVLPPNGLECFLTAIPRSLGGQYKSQVSPISEHSKLPGCSTVTGKLLPASATRTEQPLS